MKKPFNLRLEQSTVLVLDNLSRDLHISKTELIEKAIYDYAKKNKYKEHPLARFAGSVPELDVEKFIADIRKTRNSKRIKLKI